MKISTRDRIIRTAEEQMLSKGYAAARVDEICAAAGVSKGSFYHSFETKEELGLAVLAAFQARNEQLLASGSHGDIVDPAERSLALLDHVIDVAAQMWGGGCLLGSFALELGDTNPRIHREVSDLFRRVARNLAQAMEPLATENGRAAARSAKDLAEEFIIVVEGALVLAKAHGDWSHVVRALERFREDAARPLSPAP
jgi:TetR/AcrR family transcriptional repressor of nem operon